MDARLAAVQTLLKVIPAHGAPVSLTSALQESYQSDGLHKELCYGVCRWYFNLDRWLQGFLKKPLKKQDQDIYLLLLTGLYQLAWLKIPDYACISQTTQTAQTLGKHWAKGLVNGVLRSAQRSLNNATLARIQNPQTAFPDWMRQLLQSAWPDRWPDITHATQIPGPMTLRVNLSRISREDYQQQLDQQQLPACEPGQLSPAALTLKESIDVHSLPGFQSGDCSVQDEAAQLAAYLLDLQPGQSVLDACSAPGGKACHILELCPQIHELVALDQSASRLQRLHENFARLNLTGLVKQAEAQSLESWWDGKPFDRILLDAPCSGSGVIRRHPDIRLLRRPQDLETLTHLQDTLLNSLWRCLKPDGLLVYATCSIFPQENTQRIAHFLSQTPDANEYPIINPPGLKQPHGFQLFPQAGKQDGFYYAVLKKTTCSDAK